MFLALLSSEFLLVFFGLLLAVISGLFSFLDKAKENKAKKSSNRNNTGIFVVLIIGSLMSTVAAIKSVNSERINKDSIRVKDERYTALLQDNVRKSDSLNSKVDSAKNKIIELQNQGIEQSDRLRDSLDNAKSQIIYLQQEGFIELFNQATGGPSPPKIFNYTSRDTDIKRIIFMISNAGRYVIPDVYLEYIDFFELQDKYGSNSSVFNNKITLQHVKHQHITSVFPGRLTEVFSKDIPKDWPSLMYNMNVYYKTGWYRYIIHFKRNEKGQFQTVSEEYVRHINGKRVNVKF